MARLGGFWSERERKPKLREKTTKAYIVYIYMPGPRRDRGPASLNPPSPAEHSNAQAQEDTGKTQQDNISEPANQWLPSLPRHRIHKHKDSTSTKIV